MLNTFTMIIVEDEQITRDGIGALEIWNKMGIEIVALEKNARDGLMAIEELKPDIVLTDIYMPGDTGLWMAKEALKLHSTLQIILISAYDKVDDLRQAIQIGAVDYILKPVMITELEKCIGKVIDKIRCERTEREHLQNLEKSFSVNRHLVRKNILEKLIVPPRAGDENLTLICRRYNLRLSGKRFQALMMILEGQCPEPDVETFIQQNAGIDCEVIGIPSQTNRYVMLFSWDQLDGSEDISTITYRIRDAINEKWSITVGIGVGPEVDSLETVYQSVQKAQEALKRRLLLGHNQIIPYNAPELPEFDDITCSDPPDLKTVLSQGGHAAKQYVMAIQQRLLSEKKMDVSYYHHILIGEVFKIQNMLGLRESEALRLGKNATELIAHSDTLEDMCEILQGYLSEACSFEDFSAQQGSSATDAVKTVKEIIMKSYADNLTIESIANMVYLTPTYLCLCFRRHEGMTINDFLTRTRIEQAQKLLVQTRIPLNMISRNVGYENPGYFAKRFKQLVGMLPSEYRKCAVE